MRIQLRGRSVLVDLFQTKVAVASTFLALVKDEGLFIPKSLTIWENTFNESEEGRLVREEKDISGWGSAGIRNYIISVVEKTALVPTHKAVVVIDGTIREGDIPAYLTIYGPPSLSRIYGDVEFDVWPTSKVEGIAQLYYENSEVRTKLNDITAKILGKIVGKTKCVVIGKTPDAVWNVLEWAFFYSPDKKLIITNMFKTVRYLAEGGIEELKPLANIIKPYKEELFAISLFEIREFTNKLIQMAKESDAQLELRKSVMFIAGNPQSSRKFFEKFKDEILMPLKEHLKDEEYIKKILRQIIIGHKTLI